MVRRMSFVLLTLPQPCARLTHTFVTYLYIVSGYVEKKGSFCPINPNIGGVPGRLMSLVECSAMCDKDSDCNGFYANANGENYCPMVSFDQFTPRGDTTGSCWVKITPGSSAAATGGGTPAAAPAGT